MSRPDNLIPTLNRLVRTSRRLLEELSREPSAVELAQRLAIPVEQIGRLMVIAGLPVRVEASADAV